MDLVTQYNINMNIFMIFNIMQVTISVIALIFQRNAIYVHVRSLR